ncbi:MAG: B12-binding domain-containing radical SAM protein [archaeon YNP-WB-062]|nr:B12-binding domain-containing radical SAM protein [Candidatus Culexarchaeum yellowstonense]
MKVLLTADRTLMSNHHGLEFLGFGASAPPNVVPEWLFRWLFFPPVKNRDGVVLQAPYGLRKIEAQLLNEGFDVLTVDPDHLDRFIDDAKVLGIHVMDPFGLGPASSTFANVLKTGEPYVAKYFRMLLEKREIVRAKKRGLKIIVGGPGAWQFKLRPKFVDVHGIDCVINGEAEKVVGKIFKTAIEGGELPKFYEVKFDEVPSIDEIPDIRNPSINGLIEVGRGCCRGCEFCSVTLRPLRWYPYEKIEREIMVNVKAGLKSAIIHAEDVLLYGSKSVIPDEEKVLKLHKLFKSHFSSIGWSHASIAAIASKPKLIEDISEILIDGKQKWLGVEIGIETGSPELVKKAMPAKAKPFKPEEWPELVKTAAGIMMDNNIFPACTLIAGLPQETEDDIIKTIELVESLKWFKSLIVPLLFVPLGKLKDEDWFRFEDMNELHIELLIKCLEHDLYWIDELSKQYFSGWRGKLIYPFYKLFINIVRRKCRSISIPRARKSIPIDTLKPIPHIRS